MLGPASATGQKLVQKGTQMGQAAQMSKIEKLTPIMKQKTVDRIQHTNKLREMAGKPKLNIDMDTAGVRKKLNERAAQRATRAVQNQGSSAQAGRQGDGGGLFGFIRRNPVASAGMAGVGGYMMGKPAEQPQATRPMIQ